MLDLTPTYRFWSIHFHITVVQILAIILAIISKKNFKMEDRESNSNIYLLRLTVAVLHFEMTVAKFITTSFFNRPQVKKDNGYMKVHRPKSIGRGGSPIRLYTFYRKHIGDGMYIHPSVTLQLYKYN